MESNRKRRGLTKLKMAMSLYRAAKPSSTVQYSSKVKPSQSSPSTASVGYLQVDEGFVVSQPKPKPKVSFIIPADNGRHSFGQIDESFGGVAAGDESVDKKAASYISCVQERFRLERVNSERKKYQEYMH